MTEDQARSMYPDSLVDIAIARIFAGHVKDTRYGMRVECSTRFNDNRAEAEAYWPESGGGCRCWYSKVNHGVCSHWLAADLKRTPFSVNHPPPVQGAPPPGEGWKPTTAGLGWIRD